MYVQFIFLCAVLAVGLSKNTTTPAPSVCPDLAPECACEDYLLGIAANCYSVEDLEHVVESLRTSFGNKTIYHLGIFNSSFEEIPAGTFSNMSVVKLFLEKSVIGNISVNAFDGATELRVLKLMYVPGIQTLPDAVSGLKLQIFWFTSGELTSLGIQLQNITELNAVNFQHNRISFVDPEAFKHCSSLTTIDLGYNEIEELHNDVFQNLINLKEISLKFNKLFTLSNVLKPIAPTLEKLNLLGNNFTSIRDIFSFTVQRLRMITLDSNPLASLKSEDFSGKFPDLNTLSLANTSLQEIKDGTFTNLDSLQTLTLDNNSLVHIGKEAFPRNIKTIYLRNNQLTNISGAFSGLNGLQELSITGNRLRNITGMFDLLPQLRTLSLSYNLIESIPNGTFVNFPTLQFLALGRNKIVRLNNGSFFGLKRNLNILDLSSNQIEDLGGAFYSYKVLPRLTHLWLFNNSLKSVSGEDFNVLSLKEINLANNSMSTLNEAFVNLSNLLTLDLRGNQLVTVQRGNFPRKISLHFISLAGNPIVCDCRLLWLVESRNPGDIIGISGHHHIGVDDTICTWPPWLKGRYLRHVRPPEIITWKDDCPTPCKCRCYPKMGNLTIYVNCQELNMTSIPTVYPAETTLLNLSFNALEKLPRDLFDFLPKLERLDLRNNILVNLDDVLLPHTLNALNISWNNFTRFPVNALTGVNLTDVDLSENPWLCDCDADAFRNWLMKNTRIVRHLNETLCAVSPTNGELSGEILYKLTELDLCPVKIAVYASIAIGVLAILLGASAGGLGYIRYKMPIKVWLYSKGLCLRCVKEEDLDEDKDYDAFLAFSTEEEHCAKSLLAELEEKPPHFKLCVHYRDFIGGQLILENIANAVKSSKKSIILLSKSFLASEWTMTEFRQAHHQMLDEKINRIILVLVGELPPDEEIDEDVKAYLKTCTYLRWEDKYFIEKLRYAMPRNAVPRELVPHTIPVWFEDETEPLVSGE